ARNQDNNAAIVHTIGIPCDCRRVLRRYDVIGRRKGGISYSVPLPAFDWRDLKSTTRRLGYASLVTSDRRKFEVEIFPFHVEHDVNVYIFQVAFLRETSHCECQHARGGI